MSYIGNSPSSIAFLTDTFSGDGSDTTFTLSAAPASTSSILVAVSGVLQDPSTYGVSGLTLTFSAAPPSGTGNISVRYLGIPASGVTTTAYRTVTEFTATASQTTFTPPSYTVGFINVYRNGVLLGSADYTATNGTTVVLATGATAGDLVTVESFQVSSILHAIPNTAGAVSATNIDTGAVTPAKLSTGGPYWDTTNKVGIGTTSPNTPLSIVANHVGGQGVIKIQTVTSYASGGLSSISLNDSDGTRKGFIYSDVNGLGFEAINATPITLINNGSTRMAINSAGQITMPYQPSFHVHSATQSTGSGQNLVFPNEYFDIGGHYNTSNGRFTAPVAGRYMFYWSALCGTGFPSTVHRYFFLVNGGATFDQYQVRLDRTNNPPPVQGTRVVIVNLSANDYVNIYYQSDSGATSGDDATYRTFGGHLLG